MPLAAFRKGYFGAQCGRIVEHWLEAKLDRALHGFRVASYDEAKGGWRATGAADAMARLLEKNTVCPSLLKDALRYSGWDEPRVRRALVAGRQPAGEAQQKGMFGEVLHADLLERFCGMIIPVKRHRYNPSPGASPHGIDIVALGTTEPGGGERIVYAETKLRKKVDSAALAEAHRALANAGSEDVPPSLSVVMEALRTSDTDMYKRVIAAGLGKGGAHFRIGAITERSFWSDAALGRLGQAQADNDLDLGVDVVRVNELDELVAESFRMAVN